MGRKAVVVFMRRRGDTSDGNCGVRIEQQTLFLLSQAFCQSFYLLLTPCITISSICKVNSVQKLCKDSNLMVDFETEEGTAFIKEYYIKLRRAHQNELRMIDELFYDYITGELEFEGYLLEAQQQNRRLKRQVGRLRAALDQKQANKKDRKQYGCSRGQERSRSRQRKKSSKERIIEDIKAGRTTLKYVSKEYGLKIQTTQSWL